MNETRGNSRTKQVKNPIFPNNFTEGEPLKERENHSLKDSEKTTGYSEKVENNKDDKNFSFKTHEISIHEANPKTKDLIYNFLLKLNKLKPTVVWTWKIKNYQK